MRLDSAITTWVLQGHKFDGEANICDNAEAPAEAEAELAYMNAAGLLDAVVTDDGDVFLFGGETIIRK